MVLPLLICIATQLDTRTEDDIVTLKGLAGINVVEAMTKDMSKWTALDDQIYNLTESKFRSSKIKTKILFESGKKAFGPNEKVKWRDLPVDDYGDFSIIVDATISPVGGESFATIEIQVWENSVLTRSLGKGKPISSKALTYQKNEIVFASSDAFEASVANKASAMLDKFINLYWRANPK